MKRIILALAVILATATAALAHSKTEKTSPVDGSTVGGVETIELRFDDPMRVTSISLTGPQGDLDLIRLSGLDPVTEFRARPADTIPAGNYTVEWRGLAADGHPMQGSFDFTVAD